MFTGIVQNQGRIQKVEKKGKQLRLSIRFAHSEKRKIQLGESIAVNGVCLTVAKRQPSGFAADVIAATLRDTTLSCLKAGDRVNLERALVYGDSLGGHFVSGHVDARGRVKAIHKKGKNREFEIQAPASVMAFVAPKGSITVDGISLTVQRAAKKFFSVSLVPHTLRQTSLGSKKTGEAVNLEADLIARYLKLPAHRSKKKLNYKKQGF